MVGRLSQPDHNVSGAFRHMFKAETLDTSSKVGAQSAVAPPLGELPVPLRAAW
jgi:hypothetical protein